ncbi:MAG: divalent-cation tolerance protein CutA [Alphaproteobacteria bacterium]|jgi:periplasmic divalent cation tolerance protein|nr:divalent-cation tolerance protein CutA [Candidatus Jidaibacter sp.]
MSNAGIIYTTFPYKDAALEASKSLVEGGFAACVNIIDGMCSVYMWDNKLESSQEVVMIIKVLKQKMQECKEKLEEIHPYEVPCILEFECIASEKFLKFMSMFS